MVRLEMKILYLPNEYSQQRQRQKKVWIYPVHMAMEAEYYRNQGHNVTWDWDKDFYSTFGDLKEYLKYCEKGYDKIIREPEGLPFDILPPPDRIFTKAKDKKYQVYGNYKYHPATHMQVADGCWHGKCTFCVEKKSKYSIRKLEDILDEIRWCDNNGYKEIFDDSGTFPDGEWLIKFCRGKKIWIPDIVMGCNMRIGADVDFEMMKQANFRMVLFGIESANQSTLDRINKGVKEDDIIPTIKKAARAGLEPHIAVMFGLPGEGEEEERKTLELVHYLLRKGYAKTAQASIYDVAGEEKKKSENHKKIYDVAKYPEFWINKFRDIRNVSDILYLAKSIKKGLIRE